LWSQYADPSKIKSYLACGLPVITTTVTYMASVLEKNDAGIVVRYQTADVILAIKKLLNNKQLYDKYSKSTLQLIKTYDWNAVFDQAFKLS
jgi:glycosyltransferase involved in cell wall biosynthesis